MTLQASVSTPPGPVTGWFWSFDCAEACDHPVAGADLGFTYGVAAGLAGRPVALGLGINDTHPARSSGSGWVVGGPVSAGM